MNWEKILAIFGAVVAISIGLGGILSVFGSPLLDRLWMWNWLRNEDRIEKRINTIYADRIAKVDDAVEQIETNKLLLDGLTRSVADQSRALQQQVADSAEATAKSQREIADTLMEVSRELSRASNSIAHIYGLMKQEPWDQQTERRHGERRG